ncbi:MAG: outer membrane beta-barrel protein [Bdellovibrio sp.]
MKKLALTLLAVFGLSSAAMADVDYGLEVGIRAQSGDSKTAGATTDSQTGMQFGATGHFVISGPWHLRTGLLYTQRPLTVKNLGVEDKITMNYVDIPLALMYKFEEYAGVFAGVSLGMNLDKNASSGTAVTDVTSPLIPFLVGASFKFAPNLGVALYYESSSGDVSNLTKNYRAVGANLMITLD